MDDIDRWEKDPMWDDEVSREFYNLPLALTTKEAIDQGKKLGVGVPEDELYQTAHYYCAMSPMTYRSAFKHAIDFLVLDGTPILAASSGMVVETQEHSDEWGDDVAFRDKLNYITVQHTPTEYSQYCHVMKNSARDAGICVGAAVKEGQVIGIVGKNEITDRDHLHFIVFRLDKNPSPFGFKSLVSKWKDV